MNSRQSPENAEQRSGRTEHAAITRGVHRKEEQAAQDSAAEIQV
jgi:hypothetical protein